MTKEELAARWPGQFEGYTPLPNYFPEKPWGCKCHTCDGRGDILQELETMLTIARHFADYPFVITSARRCEEYNFYVGGKANSSHTRGLAVDIAVLNSVARFKILNGVILAGFMRIGINKEFIHVDIDGSKPVGVTWMY